MTSRLLRAGTLGLLLLLGTGCGNRAVVERSSDDYERSVSQSTTFTRESDMERATRLAGERDFAGAIAIYQRLYRSSPDTSVRAEALLRWGQAEGSLLNPDRDLSQAIARLELLVSEFPDSAVRETAEAEILRLQGLREGSAGS